MSILKMLYATNLIMDTLMELSASKIIGRVGRMQCPIGTFKLSKLEGIIMSLSGLKLIAIMFHIVTIAFLHNKKIPVHNCFIVYFFPFTLSQWISQHLQHPMFWKFNSLNCQKHIKCQSNGFICNH